MRQVEGITHLGDEDEQVAAKVRRTACGGRCGARNQQHSPGEAHDDAHRAPWRDALVQQDRRQDKGEDGHRRQLDGGIDGRGEAQAHDVAALGHHKAEDARSHDAQQVATLHVLLGDKE